MVVVVVVVVGGRRRSGGECGQKQREDVQFDYADSPLFGPDCFFGVYLATIAILFGLSLPSIHMCVYTLSPVAISPQNRINQISSSSSFLLN